MCIERLSICDIVETFPHFSENHEPRRASVCRFVLNVPYVAVGVPRPPKRHIAHDSGIDVTNIMQRVEPLSCGSMSNVGFMFYLLSMLY